MNDVAPDGMSVGSDEPIRPYSVSVVIPTYNRRDTVSRAIESVLAQTRPADEIIVVDDGSTDDSQSLLTERFGSQISYVRQENAGCPAARNRGIAMARGEWVALLDSDDTWLPSKLQVQLAVHETHPDLGWSATGAVLVDATGTTVDSGPGLTRGFPLFTAFDFEPEDFFAKDLNRDVIRGSELETPYFHGDFFNLLFFGNFIFPSSAIVRRRLFSLAGSFDASFRVAEETEFFHRLAAHADGAFLFSPLIRYEVGGDESLTASTNTVPLIQNALESLERARHLRPDTGAEWSESYRAGRATLLNRLAYAQLSNYDTSTARMSARTALSEGITSRAAALYLLSLLPPGILRALHAVKRRSGWNSR
jgi:glycosyltransferase involved in cell wall biosynthesis